MNEKIYMLIMTLLFSLSYCQVKIVENEGGAGPINCTASDINSNNTCVVSVSCPGFPTNCENDLVINGLDGNHLVVDCHGDGACYGTTINCPNNSTCHINSDTPGVASIGKSVINGNNATELIVDCEGDESFKASVVNANNVHETYVECMGKTCGVGSIIKARYASFFAFNCRGDLCGQQTEMNVYNAGIAYFACTGAACLRQAVFNGQHIGFLGVGTNGDAGLEQAVINAQYAVGVVILGEGYGSLTATQIYANYAFYLIMEVDGEDAMQNTYIVCPLINNCTVNTYPCILETDDSIQNITVDGNDGSIISVMVGNADDFVIQSNGEIDQDYVSRTFRLLDSNNTIIENDPQFNATAKICIPESVDVTDSPTEYPTRFPTSSPTPQPEKKKRKKRKNKWRK